MLTSDYDYALPERLIARYPPPGRADARMLVLHRAEQRLEHRAFVDFPSYLRPGDLAVLNDTRVIPARVFANEGALELLFLSQTEPWLWTCLVKPGRKARVGGPVRIGAATGIVERVLADGERVIRFDREVDLEQFGALPLPPYLGRGAEPGDTQRYQTVFARTPGAVAAPTAGLHFTPEILARVPHTFVTLHVGIGTFRTVRVDDISAHRMHAETFEISAAAAGNINQVAGQQGRVIAIGTTTVRVLEACARDEAGQVLPQHGETDIFIHPPKTLRHVDALLTNFHLPRSTLLMLVSAMAGREFVLEAYREAVAQEYRFFSYGDCMLVL
jgi:S-adenosylmethionine:tRNA ribosyltransferase-isomerase